MNKYSSILLCYVIPFGKKGENKKTKAVPLV